MQREGRQMGKMVIIRQAFDAATFKIAIWQLQRQGSQLLGAVEQMVYLRRIVTMAASEIKV